MGTFTYAVNSLVGASAIFVATIFGIQSLAVAGLGLLIFGSIAIAAMIAVHETIKLIVG